MRSSPDEDDPFGFEGPEIISCKGLVYIHMSMYKRIECCNDKYKTVLCLISQDYSQTM